MERELNYFLYDLCVTWGFCIDPSARATIAKAERYTAITFAEDVIRAEGMNPEHESKCVKKIAGLFRLRFGEDAIDIHNFEDRPRGQNEY